MIALLLGIAAASGADGAGWRLTAAYDLAAISALEGAEAPEAAPFVWRPTAAMQETCGPAKAPDGLRVFEAQAISSGMTPALALVLTAADDAPPLTTDNVRLSIGEDVPQIALMPLARPRALEIVIEYDPGAQEMGKLVRNQLAMQACLEHKTGRGWRGHALGDRVEQAFLLREPEGDRSRKYFGGELEPVTALLGPPDTCVRMRERGAAGRRADVKDPGGAKGRGQEHLVPTDVWGASLRECDVDEAAGLQASGLPPMLEFGTEDGLLEDGLVRWERLLVDLSWKEGLPESAAHSAEVWHVTSTGERTRRLAGRLARRSLRKGGAAGLKDVLAHVPYAYPEYRTPSGERYAVLVVPNWQIVEALRQLVGDAAPGAPEETSDGVGYLLSHPDQLFLQIRPTDATLRPNDTILNEARVMRGFFLRGPLGYTVRTTGSQSRILMPQGQRPDHAQVLAAHRAYEEAVLVAMSLVTVVLVGSGLVRLRDLWSRAPEERADYWPGPAQVVLAETPDNGPELEDDAG